MLFSDWLASPAGLNNFISVVGFFFFSSFPDLPTSNNVSLSPPVPFPFGIFTPPPSAWWMWATCVGAELCRAGLVGGEETSGWRKSLCVCLCVCVGVNEVKPEVLYGGQADMSPPYGRALISGAVWPLESSATKFTSCCFSSLTQTLQKKKKKAKIANN